MGLGMGNIKLNLELYTRGLFKDVRSLVDMGSQELHLTQADFESLLQAASIPGYRREDSPPWLWPAAPRLSAGLFYRLLGIETYTCVDLNGAHGAIRQDLNLPLNDPALHGAFDLVSDYGNNEHVFNVAEAYRTMHRLCRAGGYLIIDQALYNGNGYYSFETSFFEGLAAANNYEILFSSYMVTLVNKPTPTGSAYQFHIPASWELLNTLDWSKVRNIEMCYVFRKQSDADFQYPYQGDYMGEVQGHLGYRLQFLPGFPSRSYVSLPKSLLDSMRTVDVARYLAGRVSRRLRRK